MGAGRNNALREEEKMMGRVDGSEHVNFAVLLTINIFVSSCCVPCVAQNMINLPALGKKYKTAHSPFIQIYAHMTCSERMLT